LFDISITTDNSTPQLFQLSFVIDRQCIPHETKDDCTSSLKFINEWLSLMTTSQSVRSKTCKYKRTPPTIQLISYTERKSKVQTPVLGRSSHMCAELYKQVSCHLYQYSTDVHFSHYQCGERWCAVQRPRHQNDIKTTPK